MPVTRRGPVVFENFFVNPISPTPVQRNILENPVFRTCPSMGAFGPHLL